jgi:F-type H+-transporting ATPase subunit b
MELSWSTFLLEIVNFLVLVWILKRFLYKPVLDVIARRRMQIEQTLQAAKDERLASEALQTQYENRLADWEQEREARRKTLQREFEAERTRRLDALAAELEDERRKARVLAEREQRETERRLEIQALQLGRDFAARLLTRLAGPALEGRLLDVALDDLVALPEAQRQTLHQAWHNGNGRIEVISAHPVDQSRRRRLEQALTELVGQAITCNYREDPDLIAGVRLHLGAWVLHANLQDELKSFEETGRDR